MPSLFVMTGVLAVRVYLESLINFSISSATNFDPIEFKWIPSVSNINPFFLDIESKVTLICDSALELKSYNLPDGLG